MTTDTKNFYKYEFVEEFDQIINFGDIVPLF